MPTWYLVHGNERNKAHVKSEPPHPGWVPDGWDLTLCGATYEPGVLVLVTVQRVGRECKQCLRATWKR